MILENPDTLSILEEESTIESLTLRHFHKIHSLEPLRCLKNLRVLFLLTLPSWDGTGRSLVVDSFEPLTSLQKLKRIKIIGVVPKQGRLEPLSRIPSLESVSINAPASFYQTEDYAALSRSLPKARNSLRPARPSLKCPNCKMHLTLLLKGSKTRQKKRACPQCERDSLVAHLERWNNSGGIPRYEHLELLSAEALVGLFGNHDEIQTSDA